MALIKKIDIGDSLLHLRQCGEAIRSGSHAVPNLRKCMRHGHSNRRLIVYDEESFFCAGHRCCGRNLAGLELVRREAGKRRFSSVAVGQLIVQDHVQ